MDNNKITLELTGNQYNDLVRLVFLGGLVSEEVSNDDILARINEVQQKVFAASAGRKGSSIIEYDKKEDEYFLSDDLEDELMELLDEYDESRFWESLIMRLTMRDLQKKFSAQDLKEMPEEKGSKEMEVIHNYYINEFDDNDIDNLKVVAMKKV